MKILDRYIEQLLEKSSPQMPVWNIEKIKEGKQLFSGNSKPGPNTVTENG